MTVKKQKRLIVMVAALLGLSSAALLAAGFVAPVRVKPTPTLERAQTGETRDAGPAHASDPTRDGATLAQLQQLCAIDLRGELFVEEQVVNDAPPPATIRVRLIGTAIEPGRSVAVFEMTDKSIELYAIGETFKDSGRQFKVTTIQPRRVTIESTEQDETQRTIQQLVLPEAAGLPAFVQPARGNR